MCMAGSGIGFDEKSQEPSAAAELWALGLFDLPHPSWPSQTL